MRVSVGRDRAACFVLHARIQGGVDVVFPGQQLFGADAAVFQVSQGKITEETGITRADAAIGQGVGRFHHTKWFSFKAVGSCLLQISVIDHGLQHGVAPIGGTIRVGIRV